MTVEITPDHIKAMCQRNLALYASEYLRGPDKPPYNGQFLIATHHEEWAKLVNDHSRLCLQAARDHGKSHMFTLAYPLWKAEQHPGEYGFIFSASQPQAEKILLKIIDEVETNPKLQHLRPQAGGRSRKWSAQCAQFANGFTIYARGYGTKVRGAHPIFIVVDDGLNDESAFSERVRTRDIDYFQSAITNMIVPGGQIVVIGTPLHKKDLYAILEENTEYQFARYPAVHEDGPRKGQPLWPERYDSESLAKRKREIGSIKFSREFLCRVVTDGSSLFPKVLFQGDKTEQYNVRLGMPLRFWHDAGVKNVFMGVDFGLSSSVGSDYTVVWTVGLDDNKNRWIIDIQRERGLAYGAQKALVAKVANLYDPGLVYVESNQAQRIFGEELMRETDLPIKLFQTGDQKNSLANGVPAIRILLENYKFRIPRGDAHSIDMTDIWIHEMTSMTIRNGKVTSLGDHDDTVSACWIAEQAIKNGSFDFSFEEEEGDVEAFDEMLEDMMITPGHPEYLSDDAYVLGAESPKRGRPRMKNAQLSESPDDILADDPLYSGRPKKTQSVFPEEGAPMASHFTGKYR